MEEETEAWTDRRADRAHRLHDDAVPTGGRPDAQTPSGHIANAVPASIDEAAILQRLLRKGPIAHVFGRRSASVRVRSSLLAGRTVGAASASVPSRRSRNRPSADRLARRERRSFKRASLLVMAGCVLRYRVAIEPWPVSSAGCPFRERRVIDGGPSRPSVAGGRHAAFDDHDCVVLWRLRRAAAGHA